jgi:hypothetical protein
MWLKIIRPFQNQTNQVSFERPQKAGISESEKTSDMPKVNFQKAFEKEMAVEVANFVTSRVTEKIINQGEEFKKAINVEEVKKWIKEFSAKGIAHVELKNGKPCTSNDPRDIDKIVTNIVSQLNTEFSELVKKIEIYTFNNQFPVLSSNNTASQITAKPNYPLYGSSRQFAGTPPKKSDKKIEEKPEEKSKRKSDQKFYNKSVDILYKERQQENKGTSRWDA